MSDLLDSLSAAGRWRDLAWVGYYNGDAGLAQGFAEAAEAVFAAWENGPHSNDRLFPPLAYNYRHALELSLKQAIRQAAARLRFDGDDDPGLAPEALETYFKQKQRHRLEPLARQLAGMLAKLKLDNLPPETMRLLAQLHQLDPTGESFRYDCQLRTNARQVDVGQLVELFRAAVCVIHDGLPAVLDQYADFQYEMSHYCTGGAGG